ncbi:MAG: nucleotidyl transferase AbiEii/AbiGii toxin family protein [Ferruginibacter sp.]
MQIPALNDFYLVGGTALALYFGHRLSVDLVLFSTTEFNIESLIAPLQESFRALLTGAPTIPLGCLEI